MAVINAIIVVKTMMAKERSRVYHLEDYGVAAHGHWASRLTLSETHSSVSHFSIW